jgi:metal transporter CNNM
MPPNLHSMPDPETENPGSAAFWSKLLISFGLVILAGVFAGLTLGLMGLDELHLRVLATSSDDEKERANASKGTGAVSSCNCF